MPDKDELDFQLDAALSSYGDPGPESGLEERVLARLAAVASGSRIPALKLPMRRRWLHWALAVPVGAAALLLWFPPAGLHRGAAPEQSESRKVARNSERSDPTLRAAHSASDAVSAQSLPRRSGPRSRRLSNNGRPELAGTVADKTALPKLDVFPTPQPLSEEEQALVTVASRTSAPVKRALAEAQSRGTPQVRIAAIHIPPLESPDEGQP